MLVDVQRTGSAFPIPLQDIQWQEPQDIVTVFDLDAGEAAQDTKEAALPGTSDSLVVVPEETSFAPADPPRKLKRGRKQGERDWSFADRLQVIHFAVAEMCICSHKSGRMVNNLPKGQRAIPLPWMSTADGSGSSVSVAVDTVLEWHKLSIQQRWEDMIADGQLQSELGSGCPPGPACPTGGASS